MSIQTDLNTIKTINVNSTQSLINISNDNFKKISSALYTFLTNILYDETTNTISLTKLNVGEYQLVKEYQLLLIITKCFR